MKQRWRRPERTPEAMRATNLLHRWPELNDLMAGPAGPQAAAIAGLVPRERAVLLDLGCGTGRVSRELLTHRPRWDVWGIDWQPQLIEYAVQVCPGPSWEVGDIRHAHIGRSADMIICLDVLADMLPRASKRVLETAVRNCRVGTFLVLQVMASAVSALPVTQEIATTRGMIRCRTTTSVVESRLPRRQTIRREWYLPDGTTRHDTYSRWGTHPATLVRCLAGLGFTRCEDVEDLLVFEFTRWS